VKFSDQPPADTWHAYSVLKGNGSWAQPVVSVASRCRTSSTTSCLTICLYVDLFYRFLRGGLSPFSCETLPHGAAPGSNSGVSLAWNAADALTKPTTQELKWLHQSLFAKH
jgi:hypothetical protein